MEMEVEMMQAGAKLVRARAMVEREVMVRVAEVLVVVVMAVVEVVVAPRAAAVRVVAACLQREELLIAPANHVRVSLQHQLSPALLLELGT